MARPGLRCSPARLGVTRSSTPRAATVRERLQHVPQNTTSGLFAPNAGITLMELMVVAAILALVVGISFPSVSSGLDSVRLASATQTVASFLNSAVDRSERRQEPVEVVIVPKQNLMTAYGARPGFERRLALPQGVHLEAVLPPVEDSADDVRSFLLLPGATVPGIGIQLANDHGSRRIVQLDPMTGFPTVKTVVSK